MAPKAAANPKAAAAKPKAAARVRGATKAGPLSLKGKYTLHVATLVLGVQKWLISGVADQGLRGMLRTQCKPVSNLFFFLLGAAWVRSRAERPSVS